MMNTTHKHRKEQQKQQSQGVACAEDFRVSSHFTPSQGVGAVTCLLGGVARTCRGLGLSPQRNPERPSVIKARLSLSYPTLVQNQ